MDHQHYDDKYIGEILREVNTIALVGASAKPARPSFGVLKYLLSKGYEVIPVNPGQAGGTIAGQRVVGSLSEIARPIDMVDIFRNSNAALSVVEEALELVPVPKVIWMQLSVFNEQAARLGEAKGIKVVMNRCPKIEHHRLLVE